MEKSRILIVQKTYLEVFGVMSIASVLQQAGHEVRVSLERGKKLVAEVADYQPHVLGFTAVTMNVHTNLDDAGLLKQHMPDCPIIFGGVHATFFPELVEQPQVDAVCRGEGEGAMADYCAVRGRPEDAADIPNLWIKAGGEVRRNPLRPPIADLDSLPFPDRSVYYDRYSFLRNNPVKNFLCSRGCPFGCSFCFNKTYRKLYRENGHVAGSRMRSPENIIGEIQEFRAKWPLEKLAFQDENFSLNKEWLFGFLKEYRRHVKLPFFCMVHAGGVDEEIVIELKRSGCFHTTFGVESGDQDLRNSVLKKNVTNEQILRSAELLHKHGLTFHTTNIMGFPGDTVKSAVSTLRFNARVAPDSTIAFMYMPFTNLELTNEAVAGGYLSEAESRDWARLPRTRVRVPNWRRIVRLRSMFGVGVRRPSLIPLIVFLSALPIGPLLTLLARVVEVLDHFSRNRHNTAYMLRHFMDLRRLYKSYFYE